MAVIVQAGHLHIANHCFTPLRSATGAPGEAGWSAVLAQMIADRLVTQGVSARAVDANFTCLPEVGEDNEAVIALHYQANLPTDSGFFVGTGAGEEDGAADESVRLAAAIRTAYEQRTGLRFQPGWTSIGIAHNYVFEKLSPATPFCLLEAGVGWGPDRDLLHSRQGMASTADAVASGVTQFLNGRSTTARSTAPDPIPRQHTVDIDTANALLHHEPTDLNGALHDIALELTDLRAERDHWQRQLDETTQVLNSLTQLVRR